MKYMEHLQSGLGRLIAASDAGRHCESEMLEPLSGAISDIRCAAASLECLTKVEEVMAARLWRTLRAIQVAQATLNARVLGHASSIRNVLDLLAQQVARVNTLIGRVTGTVTSSRVEVVSTIDVVKKIEIPKEALGPNPHLLILQPLSAQANAFYFNLDTAGVRGVQRSSAFGCPNPSDSASGESERITISGLMHPSFNDGFQQLQRLRSFGQKMKPLSLCTGLGESLGVWCLTAVTESQGVLLAGGAPESQAFTLELVSHGNDLQNI